MTVTDPATEVAGLDAVAQAEPTRTLSPLRPAQRTDSSTSERSIALSRSPALPLSMSTSRGRSFVPCQADSEIAAKATSSGGTHRRPVTAAPYLKRALAADLADVTTSLGHQRFG
jgi:hypothetical protein